VTPSGVVLCLLTALSWGIWTVCLKQATRVMPPMGVQVITTCLNMGLVPLYLYTAPTVVFNRGLVWAALSVIFGAIGGLLNLTALSRMDASVATAIVATYPAVTMLTLVLVGQEALTWAKALGVGLVILGIGVLSLDPVIEWPVYNPFHAAPGDDADKVLKKLCDTFPDGKRPLP